MGMFDNVNYEAPCWNCGHPLTRDDFQSKDGPCLLKYIDPKEVSGFYAHCPKCGKWNNYHTKRTFTLEGIVPQHEQDYEEE